jgi:class 3 adenylate cyclase
MRDLDPEEARAVIDPVLRLMIEAVHRYSGYVAQSTGDGIFAMFGAPVAHEAGHNPVQYTARPVQYTRSAAPIGQTGQTSSSVNSRGVADLLVCFVNSRGAAGWNRKHRLQGKL